MPAPRGLVQQIDQGLHKSGLLPQKARLLIAVSGGADSVALLRLLDEIRRSDHWQWHLIVAHVDHGIRGPESAADAKFVSQLAKKLKLPFALKRLRLPPGTSEDAARQARLNAFSTMLRSQKADGIVMAHHADDQAETILMRIFRGTGLQGLSGMSPFSKIADLPIYRPLLGVRRMDLRHYLDHLSQTWREDATNASDQYLRNRVRRNLMPLLEVLWPRSVEALGRLALLAADSWDVISQCADAAQDSISVIASGHQVAIPRDTLRKLPPAIASELLRRIIFTASGSSQIVDFNRIAELMHHLQSNHGGIQIQVGNGIAVTLNRDALLIHLQQNHTRKIPSRRAKSSPRKLP